MASWIVHLRIAENLLRQIPDLVPPSFAAGNIAPDSGIPDEKWENFTPPAQITHFQFMQDGWNNAADLDFFRQYLAPLAGETASKKLSFRMGYFCHLITDNLWGQKIGKPTLVHWSEQFAADRDFIWVVKKDWYGLDFLYLRDHPDCIFWRLFLTIQAENGGLDFLPLEAVRQRVEYIQQYYQRRDEEIQKGYLREFTYLTAPEMDLFVEETTQQIFQIYQRLWIDRIDPGSGRSTLEMIA